MEYKNYPDICPTKLKDNKIVELEIEVHAIKSLAGSVGASKLQAIAASFELVLKNKESKNYLENSKSFTGELSHIIAILKEYLEKPDKSQ